MIFLVGARRSGTNWLHRIVAAHPDVASIPSETYLFSRGIAPLSERFQHGSPGSRALGVIYMDRARFLDALRDFCDQVFTGMGDVVGPGASRICERTPENTTALDLIGDIYPDARVVHIIRDGRDVTRSLASQDWGPGSIRAAAEEWVTSVSKARLDGKNLAHYREVRYEEMLADPRPHVTELYGWLGVDTRDDVVDAALTEAGVAFNVDPRFPTVAVGKWRETFSADDERVFHEIGGALLHELGYASGDPGALALNTTTATAAAASTTGPDPASTTRTPLADRVRRSVRRAGGATLRRLGLRAAPGEFDAEFHRRIFEVQEGVDACLGAIATGRFDDIASMTTATVHCRVVTADGEREGRGDAGLALLLGALRSDDALRGRHVRGDVHPAVPMFTVVSTYRTDDGRTHDRVLTVMIEGDRISRIAYYALPLAAA
jgi:hypothetical protein